MKRLLVLCTIWHMADPMFVFADEPMLVIDPQGHSL